MAFPQMCIWCILLEWRPYKLRILLMDLVCWNSYHITGMLSEIFINGCWIFIYLYGELHIFLMLVLPVTVYRISMGKSVSIIKTKITKQNLLASVLNITVGSLNTLRYVHDWMPKLMRKTLQPISECGEKATRCSSRIWFYISGCSWKVQNKPKCW